MQFEENVPGAENQPVWVEAQPPVSASDIVFTPHTHISIYERPVVYDDSSPRRRLRQERRQCEESTVLPVRETVIIPAGQKQEKVVGLDAENRFREEASWGVRRFCQEKFTAIYVHISLSWILLCILPSIGWRFLLSYRQYCTCTLEGRILLVECRYALPFVSLREPSPDNLTFSTDSW